MTFDNRQQLIYIVTDAIKQLALLIASTHKDNLHDGRIRDRMKMIGKMLILED